MKQFSADCVRLKEYREEVLGAPQTEVALRAKVSQARISAIEAGKLPRKWNWPPFLKAYGLTESEFHRLVTGEAKLRALTVPVAEDLPLFASEVHGSGARSIGMSEERNAPASGSRNTPARRFRPGGCLMDALRIPPRCPWLHKGRDGTLMAAFPGNDGEWTAVIDDRSACASDVRSRHIRDTVGAMGETYWRIEADRLKGMDVGLFSEEALSIHFQLFRDAVEQTDLWRRLGDSARR